MACARFVVRGRVQGVYFRASTREQALRLGLAGYAENLANGDVEVLACGSSEALAQLQCWLRRGPPSAQVESVTRIELPEQTLHGFAMR